MPEYLNTTGNATLGIGVCSRCNRKFPLGKLLEDPNSPGLRVCKEDQDVLDPYRIATAPNDPIQLPFVRPDVSLVQNDAGWIVQGNDYFYVANDGTTYWGL